jgi:hypothetical protein
MKAGRRTRLFSLRPPSLTAGRAATAAASIAGACSGFDAAPDLQSTNHCLIVVGRNPTGFDVSSDFHTCPSLTRDACFQFYKLEAPDADIEAFNLLMTDLENDFFAVAEACLLGNFGRLRPWTFREGE